MPKYHVKDATINNAAAMLFVSAQFITVSK